MIRNLYKIIAACVAIAGITLYLVLMNREVITLSLTGSRTITAPAGAIFIVVFLFGGICTAIVASFFGVKAYFRERRLTRQEDQRKRFYQGLLEARGYLASRQWDKAHRKWEELVRKDPTDLIARVEL